MRIPGWPARRRGPRAAPAPATAAPTSSSAPATGSTRAGDQRARRRRERGHRARQRRAADAAEVAEQRLHAVGGRQLLRRDDLRPHHARGRDQRRHGQPAEPSPARPAASRGASSSRGRAPARAAPARWPARTARAPAAARSGPRAARARARARPSRARTPASAAPAADGEPVACCTVSTIASESAPNPSQPSTDASASRRAPAPANNERYARTAYRGWYATRPQLGSGESSIGSRSRSGWT